MYSFISRASTCAMPTSRLSCWGISKKSWKNGSPGPSSRRWRGASTSSPRSLAGSRTSAIISISQFCQERGPGARLPITWSTGCPGNCCSSRPRYLRRPEPKARCWTECWFRLLSSGGWAPPVGVSGCGWRVGQPWAAHRTDLSLCRYRLSSFSHTSYPSALLFKGK